MSDTLIDANVLIDVFAADPQWKDWSKDHIAAAQEAGQVIINPIIYAEVSAMFPTQRKLDEALGQGRYKRENMPWDAAFNAGRAFVAYRRAGGTKRSPLPDFYIGAHADLQGYFLLTRDDTHYRRYFPTYKIVSPDTDP